MLPEPVFLDTSFILALLDTKDKWHQTAQKIIASLDDNTVAVVGDAIIAETISTAAKRIRERRKFKQEEKEKLFIEFVENLKQFCLECEQIPLFSYAEKYFDSIVKDIIQTKGKLNFNDMLIINACRSLEIKKILTFDNDFAEYMEIIRHNS